MDNTNNIGERVLNGTYASTNYGTPAISTHNYTLFTVARQFNEKNSPMVILTIHLSLTYNDSAYFTKQLR
jgi:hypothetical protein